jgi:hypothetical protein
MATYTITNTQVVDNVGVVATLTPTPVEVGDSITISGLAGWNATYVVTAVPQYLFTGVDQFGDYLYDTATIIPNQIAFAKTAANQARTPATGTLTYTVTPTWISVGDVEDWLGFTIASPSGDYDLLTLATAASNYWCWNRRREAGYSDSITTVPNNSAKLAAVMYAGYLYRMRGSIDQYASFDPLATGAPVGGSFGDILRLLGCNRPQVA